MNSQVDDVIVMRAKYNDEEECSGDQSAASGNGHHDNTIIFRAQNETRRQVNGANRQSTLLEIVALAARETKWIHRWKVCFLTSLVITATLLAAGTYTVLHKNEEQKYHQAVRDLCIFIRISRKYCIVVFLFCSALLCFVLLCFSSQLRFLGFTNNNSMIV
jgi:membrane glycosyltransferase